MDSPAGWCTTSLILTKRIRVSLFRHTLYVTAWYDDATLASFLFCRYLSDSNARSGQEQIANGFVFEEDKKKALNILYTVGFMATVVA